MLPYTDVNNVTALKLGESDPIVQIEYDASRQLLYTRSEAGSIYLYDLGLDGQSIRLSVLLIILYCR